MSTVISVISAIFWGALLLSILVFLHEGGHYLAARASGMRVTEFFLGMPCRLKLSHISKSHGTEIGVTPVLLGGYTRICGMEGTPSERCSEVLAYIANHGAATPEEIAAELHISSEQVIKDIDVLIDWGSIMTATCTYAELHPDDIYASDARKAEEYNVAVTVERDPNLLCILDKGHDFSQPGSTKAGEPHGLASMTAPEFFERERKTTYLGKGFLARVFALLAGPVVNILLGLITIALVLSITGVEQVVDSNKIASVTQDSIAAEGGMQDGDTITSVNGTAVSTWTEFCDAIDKAKTSTESFTVEYIHAGESEIHTIDVTTSELVQAGMFGVVAQTYMYHPALADSLRVSWNYVGMTANYVLQLFQPAHTAEIVSQSSSVVGISVVASEAAASGVSDFIYLLAAVSLSLGFMNLIPIPPLDGGKLLIEVIQLILRRPLSEKVQLVMSYIGLALFMTLFVFVLRNDIINFVIGG